MNLTDLRTRTGKTLREVAFEMGCAPSTVQRYEKRSAVPKGKNVERLAAALNISKYLIDVSYTSNYPPIFTFISGEKDIFRDACFYKAKRLCNKLFGYSKLCLTLLQNNQYAKQTLTCDDKPLETAIKTVRLDSAGDCMLPISLPLVETPDYIDKILSGINFYSYDFIILFLDYDSALLLKDEIKGLSEQIFMSYNTPKDSEHIINWPLKNETVICTFDIGKSKTELKDIYLDEQIIDIYDDSLNPFIIADLPLKSRLTSIRINKNVREHLWILSTDANIPVTRYVEYLLENTKNIFGNVDVCRFIQRHKDTLEEIKQLSLDMKQTTSFTEEHSIEFFHKAKQMGHSYAHILSLIIEVQFNAYQDSENKILFTHNWLCG